MKKMLDLTIETTSDDIICPRHHIGYTQNKIDAIFLLKIRMSNEADTFLSIFSARGILLATLVALPILSVTIALILLL